MLAIYAGLMVALSLAALDQAIVATAVPAIVSEIGGLTQYSWVFTAYLLASTVTIPLYGKLGDLYGRRRLLSLAVAVFLVGSALCGAAQTMTQLLVFRTIQGIGAGGLVPIIFAIASAIVPLRERGRYQGILASGFAASSMIGPVAGGLLADHASWRWIFFINLPLGGLALALVLATIPRRIAQQPVERSVDWLGAMLLAGATTALLLGLVWGGDQHPWLSPHVLAAFGSALALGIGCAIAEARARDMILPFGLARRRTPLASLTCAALTGMTMLGLISYVPLFVQGVVGASATASAVVLTPLLLGTVVAAFVSGQWVSRSGRTRPTAVAGTIVMFSGVVLVWRLEASTSYAHAAVSMLLVGLGVGLMMQVFILSVQASVPRAGIGSATALVQFVRMVGATVGVAAMGALVNRGVAGGDLEDGLRSAFLAPVVAAGLVLVIVLFALEDAKLEGEPEIVGVS